LPRRFCRSERCAGNAAACVVGGDKLFLVFAADSHLVTPFRVRSGCIRTHNDARSATARPSTAQTDREELEQPDAPPALKPFLLLTPDSARTGTRAANSSLATMHLMLPKQNA